MESTAQAFTGHLQKLSEIARRHNIYHSYQGGQGCFEKLSEAEKTMVITGLKKYGDLLSGFEEQDLDFDNTAVLLKAALKMLNLNLAKETMDLILPTDFVEIYTDDFVPAFRSPNFWGTSSYGLDEIYTYPYDQLFERSEFFQAAINRAAQAIFSGRQPILHNPIPTHPVWEKKGPRSCEIKYRFLASIYDPDGDIAGALVVCDIKPLALKESAQKPERGPH